MWQISNVFLTCYIFIELISFFGHFQILCCHIDMKAQPHGDALASKLERTKRYALPMRCAWGWRHVALVALNAYIVNACVTQGCHTSTDFLIFICSFALCLYYTK